MEPLRIALPSKGELEAPTLAFLDACGLAVRRASSRQYTARLTALDDAAVIFQRSVDIFARVDENSVDLGITGYDIVRESAAEEDRTLVIYDDLGYGHCELVLAVPDSWLDVSALDDLAVVESEFRQRGRELRIATKYPNLTRRFLYQRGLRYFALVGAYGALEAAVELGYADLIADITTSGLTLRANHLKRLAGGTILAAHACLIANRAALVNTPGKLQQTRQILELIEAQRRSVKYRLVSAQLRAESERVLSERLSHAKITHLRNISITRLSPVAEGFSLALMVAEENLMGTVALLRAAGASELVVSAPQFLFEEESRAYKALAARLRGSPQHQDPHPG